MTSMEDHLIALAFTLIGGFVFFLGFFKWRRFRIIRDTPTSRIRSVAMGIVEIHGTVEADELLRAPYSQTECVYFKWEVKEYRRSGSGKNSSNKWQVIGYGDLSVPFFARDDTGRVLVKPHKAEFMLSHKRVYYQEGRGVFGSLKALPRIIGTFGKFDRGNPHLFSEGGNELVPMVSESSFRFVSVGDRKYYEYYVEPNDSLYVLGTAAIDRSAPDSVVIRRGKNERTFIISDKSEKGLLKSLKKTMLVCFIFGGIFFAAGIVMALMNLGIIEKG